MQWLVVSGQQWRALAQDGGVSYIDFLLHRRIVCWFWSFFSPRDLLTIKKIQCITRLKLCVCVACGALVESVSPSVSSQSLHLLQTQTP